MNRRAFLSLIGLAPVTAPLAITGAANAAPDAALKSFEATIRGFAISAVQGGIEASSAAEFVQRRSVSVGKDVLRARRSLDATFSMAEELLQRRVADQMASHDIFEASA